MIRSERRKQGRRRLYLVGFVVILLTASGGILYRLPLSLQDIGRIFDLAVGRISGTSADGSSAEPVLRGTIYDRLFKEMAVSYHLFTLTVHPVELGDREETARALAGILGEERDRLVEMLKTSQRIVEVADDLDEDQARAITRLHMAGLYLRPHEERFYPAHTVAAHLLGFTGDGVGLAGVEGRYDIVLQPGEFRSSDVPEIDFAGRQVLGRSSTDLVLTVDLGMEKLIGQRLRQYLKSRLSRRGMALLLDPGDGRILAMASQPAFNPNYFWHAYGESFRNRLFEDRLDLALVRGMLVRAAAVLRDGGTGGDLLPETVAAPDFGVSASDINDLARLIGMFRPAGKGLLAASGRSGASAPDGNSTGVNCMQMAVGLACLVNGGWWIAPWLLDSLYDHATARRYGRRQDATRRELLLEPAMGIRMRRGLLLGRGRKGDGATVFTGTVNRVVRAGSFSSYVRQEALVGLIPARAPRLVLLMVVERDSLDPLPPHKAGTPSLAVLGRDLLPRLLAIRETAAAARVPLARNPENFRQFLISRRLDYREQPGMAAEEGFLMPRLIGLSLRQGLQRLGRQPFRLTIRGSGRIIAQKPAAGTPLHDVTDCVLTLEPTISNSK